MPNVVVKLPRQLGRAENQLAEEIVKDVIRILDRKKKSFLLHSKKSIPRIGPTKVYIPDIQGKWNLLYKKRGYNPFKMRSS